MKKTRSPEIKHLGLLSALWIVGIAAYTIGILFGVPYLQKKVFFPNVTDFLYYESILGVFTILSFVAFALFLLLLLILLVSPPADSKPKTNKTMGILIIILGFLILLGTTEAFVSYRFIRPSTLGMRSLYTPVEKNYQKSDLRQVIVSTVKHKTNRKLPTSSYLKWEIVLADGNTFPIESLIHGGYDTLKKVYPFLSGELTFTCKQESDQEWWNNLEQDVFKDTLNPIQ